MPLYEHVFLARQDISTQQVEAMTKDYSQIIMDSGGTVPKNEYWGVKTLAFKIKKNRKAHYTLLNLDANPAAVAEMERQMSLSPDILRFMTIRVEELEKEPSIQMRKGDRDDRRDDRRGDRDDRRGDRPERADRGDRGDRGPRPPRRTDGGGSTFRASAPQDRDRHGQTNPSQNND